MFKHKERIRHPLKVATIPSADVAAASLLFSPIALRSGVTLAERTWVPAMVPWRATEDGFVTPDILDWYGRFAEGQPGAIVVEATGIRDVPSGPLLRIGHDRFIDGLRALVEVVRERSEGRTRLLIQIIDFLRIRRRPDRTRYLSEFLQLSERHPPRETLLAMSDAELAEVLTPRELEAMSFGARERVWDEAPHIVELPQTLPDLFAAAARRARLAGFDGVELHYAHAYTMASFLSARNRRSDGYGITREGRVRLPIEVFAKVRSEVGDDFAVGCRFLCDEIIDGGSRVDDAMFFGVAFAEAGMDYVSLSTGGKFEDAKQPRVGEAAYPYTGRSGWECMPTSIADALGPYGRNIPKQAQIRHAIRHAGHDTPVVICGGINDFAQAEAYLEKGHGDIIGAARQSLADPDWFRKLRSGEGATIRRCIYRNYCEALDQKHRKVTCQLWDRDEDGQRRFVAPSDKASDEASG